ncbi:hypothetical protein [Nonomuraea endophytica]|uniref:hypothetical protein n=1 Tax=Nonomuraea endophytica TaxID=714136 RepID=UPI0037C59F1F
MPAQVLGFSTAVSGTGSAFTCEKPAGLIEGARLISFHATDRGTVDTMGDPTGGTPWNHTYNSQWLSLEAGAIKICAKFAGPSEPNSYEFTQDQSADGIVFIVAIKDAGTFGGGGTGYYSSSGVTVTSHPSMGILPLGNEDLELRFIATRLGSAVTWSPPPGYTLLRSIQSGNYTNGALAYRTFTSAVESGQLNFASSTGLSLSNSFTIRMESRNPPAVKAAVEAASAIDQRVLSAHLLRTDSLALTETVHVARIDADQGAMADSATITAAAGRTDTGSVLEAAIPTATTGPQEVAALEDSARLTIILTSGDHGALDELVAHGKPASDRATLSEAASRQETLGPSTSDSISVIEGESLGGQSSRSDGALLADAASLTVQRTSSDAGALTEHVIAGPATKEMAILAELAGVLVVLDRQDAVTLTANALSSQPIAATDVAALTETALAAETGKPITGADGPRRTWGATTGNRTLSAEQPRRTWSASTLP